MDKRRHGGKPPACADPPNVAPGARLLIPRDDIREITFRDFGALATRRGWTVESLTDLFRGKIEEPREFFTRVMACRYQKQDLSDVVIPYRSVIEFYLKAQVYQGFKRYCHCGCGNPVFGQKKWATPGCRKRAQRRELV